MNFAVGELLDRQKRERMDFCGFASSPTDIQVSIVELVGRFENINVAQLIELLNPWFHKDLVSSAVEKMIFDRELMADLLFRSLKLPQK